MGTSLPVAWASVLLASAIKQRHVTHRLVGRADTIRDALVHGSVLLVAELAEDGVDALVCASQQESGSSEKVEVDATMEENGGRGKVG